jgi:hypothetical protein
MPASGTYPTRSSGFRRLDKQGDSGKMLSVSSILNGMDLRPATALPGGAFFFPALPEGRL